MRRTFVKESFLSAPPADVFSFHERPDAFNLLSPPGEGVEVETTASTLRPSTDIVRFTKRVMGLPFRFAMVHTAYEAPHLFVDEQLRGPFAYWRHSHRFIAGGWRGDPATLLSDRIDYGHPLLWAGNLAVAYPLRQLFAYRHGLTASMVHEARRAQGGSDPRRIVVTGATGLIGGRITEILIDKGIKPIVLVRNPSKSQQRFGDAVTHVTWDFHRPDQGDWAGAVAQADGIIHLAGTPLFKQRWSPDFKREMRESRTRSTRQLVEAMTLAPPREGRFFLCGTAIGVYGKDPMALAHENSPSGDDLLADICRDWEQEALAAREADIRTVLLRTGVVLHPRSGALGQMLPLFKLGGGGVLGAPDRWINWIHLEDTARLFLMAMEDQSLSGPLNVVSPRPVSNQAMAQTLAHVLRRPCLFRYPETLIRLGIGEAAEYAAGGPRVTADAARSRGYEFFFSDLEPALRNLLGRP